MMDIMRWSVRDALFDAFGVTTEIIGNIMYGRNEYITVHVTSPYKLDELGWRIMLAPSATFDRWSNSVVIDRRFNTNDDLVLYLEEHDTRLNVYKELYEAISRQVEEMKSRDVDHRFD